MSLSKKSNDDIKKLLDQYGIKHGPVTESTRKQYEKKLEKAMEQSPGKSSSDKTYYREEEEETTYITYHSPVRQEGFEDTLTRRGTIHQEEDKKADQDTEQNIQISRSRTLNHSVMQSSSHYRGLAKKSGGSVWKAIRLLLLLAVLAVVLYYAYCRLW